MAGDKQGFTPILIAAANRSWTGLDYMLDRDEITRKEKIDAFEMAAAAILSSNDWGPEQDRAFEYLRKALLLRQMETELFHMTPLKLKRGRTIGWTTSAQLDQVIEEPAEYHFQSYLIQLRILSDSGRSYHQEPLTHAFDLRQLLLGCIKYLKEQDRLDDIVDVLWATFEKIRLQLLDSYHEYGLWRMAYRVVEKLIWVLSQLGKDDLLYNANTFRSILKLMLVTERVHSRFCTSRILCCHRNGSTRVDILLQLVTFLAALPLEIMKDETQELSIKELLHQLVCQDSHTDRTKRGPSLLHIACDDANLDLATVRLLQFNTDPNAGDEDGNGPFHVLASLRYRNDQELLVHRAGDIARLLLENGAHLDRVNKDRKTAADVWKEENGSQDLPNWLLDFSCLE